MLPRCQGLPASRHGCSTPAGRQQCPPVGRHNSKQGSCTARHRLVSCAASGSDSNSSGSGQPGVFVAEPQLPGTPPLQSGAPPPAAAAGSTAPGAPADTAAALAARIAAAKAYKSGAASSATAAAAAAATTPGITSSTESPQQQQSADTSLSEQQQEEMRQQYLAQLQQQQQELAAQSSAYNSFLQQQSSSSSSEDPLERLAAEDPGWGPGSATGPARPDFYTSADAPEVQQLLSSAPKRKGTGSADEAADWLQGVLQDTGACWGGVCVGGCVGAGVVRLLSAAGFCAEVRPAHQSRHTIHTYAAAPSKAAQRKLELHRHPSDSGVSSPSACAVAAVAAGKPQVDSNMRMEDITLAKEAALKQRGAEIITAFPEDFASSSSSSTAGDGGSSSTAAGSGAAGAADGNVDEDGK